ncbi:oncostatin-M [Rhynchocyon petersi]
MRVQLTWRTLPGLVLGLLLLSTVAMGSCSKNYHQLVHQLRNQASMLQDTSRFLDPYMHLQGLKELNLKDCRKTSGIFPSKDFLQGLSKRGFLQTLNASVDLVLQSLDVCREKVAALSTDGSTGWQKLCKDNGNLRGVKNNIFCLAQFHHSSPETVTPTWTGLKTSPLPIFPSSFQDKWDGCKFFQDFHRFMHSVGQVLGEWQVEGLQRSRRHSPRRAPRGQAHRTRPSRRAKMSVPQGMLPW